MIGASTDILHPDLHPMTPFSLATIAKQDAAEPCLESQGQYWLLKDLAGPRAHAQWPRGLIDLFADWDRNFDLLSDLCERREALAAPLDLGGGGPRFLTPLQYPAKVVLTGTNYYDHLRAVGRTDFSKADNSPAIFLKPPTTCLVGPGPIRHPEGSTQFDWEIELAAIFGRRCRKAAQAQALDHVAAYAVGLDMSARDLQRNPKHFAKMDLCLGKAFDDSCPLGPRIVPAAFVRDPQDLSMKLWVNGKIEQDSNTRHMIWSVAEQIEVISRLITLEPGDVLMTGTPAGTGIEQERYLSIGDRIDADIEGLGRMSVHIVQDH